MTDLSLDSVEKIGLEAAREVMGEKIEEVEAEAGQDSSDRPAYFISFRIDPDQDRATAALLRTRLAQKIRDELIAQGDEGYPIIRMLNDEEWVRRARARSG
jgi:hypothetical protein